MRELVTLFGSVLSIYFLSRHVRGPAYFSFALVGVAALDYLMTSLTGMSRGLRLAQTLGTLEAMLATPAPRWTIAAGSAAYRMVWSAARVSLIAVLGLALGATFDVSWGALALAVAASLVAFAALGLLSAASVLVFKAFEPVTALLLGLSGLLGGVLYPITALPEPLQPLAWLLPLTHALEALRGALGGAGVEQIASQLVVLLGFAAICGPLGAWAFRRALQRLRVEGSVSHY